MKIKKGELKLRMSNAAERLINAYFGENNIVEKLTNSTLKVLLKQNMDKLDGMMDMFCDENGEIEADEIINTYAEQISESGVTFDIREYVKSDVIRGILPNKSLIIKKSDITRIIEQ